MLQCEAEMDKAGMRGLLHAGDMIWDVVVEDKVNLWRMVWDGRYLIDLDYTFSITGNLPRDAPGSAPHPEPGTTLSPSPSPQNAEQSQYANDTDSEERARSLDPPQEIDLKSCQNKLSEISLLSDENDSAAPHERERANMPVGYEAAGPNTTFRTGGDYFWADAGARIHASAVFGGTGLVKGWKGGQMTYFNSLLESDNKVKTEKLQEALARLSSLEAELTKLKPISLLKLFPSSSRTSHSALFNASTYLSSLAYSAATGDGVLVVQKQGGARKKKDEDPKVPSPAHGGSDEDKCAEAVLTNPGIAAKSDAEGSAFTSTLPLLDPSLNINGQTSYLSAAQHLATVSLQYRFAVVVYAHLQPKSVQSSGQTVYSKKGHPPYIISWMFRESLQSMQN
ncbi:hypothetical protein EDD85DRAFT_957673 [Armillaria nabsnona]|nr:hypothetical protein EDD85DRAFT_957673 [Armillaria nabsnona]